MNPKNGETCAIPKCDWTRDIDTIHGECKECEDYTIPIVDLDDGIYKTCQIPDCLFTSQIVTKKGKCERCKVGSTPKVDLSTGVAKECMVPPNAEGHNLKEVQVFFERETKGIHLVKFLLINGEIHKMVTHEPGAHKRRNL